MKRDASRTRGDLAVQASLPVGQPPVAPIWARPGAGRGGVPGKLQPKRKRPPIVGFRMLRVALVAIAGKQAVLALAEGPQPRVFLSVRNSSTSSGNLLVAFGTQPTSIDACDFELTPGGVLLMDGYSGVPQDDIWIFSTAGASGSISYGMKG